MYAEVEGQTVRVGDFVGFKRGTELRGRILRIKASALGTYLNVSVENDEGDEETYAVTEEECWIEG